MKHSYQAAVKFSGERCGHRHRTRATAQRCADAKNWPTGSQAWKVYEVVEAEGFQPMFLAEEVTR